jgi:hypothetical protein
MKTLLACAFCISLPTAFPAVAIADTDMNTAMDNCRQEAISTGLQDETAITEYIDLCMQAWQVPSEYTEPPIVPEDTGEPPMELPEDLQR